MADTSSKCSTSPPDDTIYRVKGNPKIRCRILHNAGGYSGKIMIVEVKNGKRWFENVANLVPEK